MTDNFLLRLEELDELKIDVLPELDEWELDDLELKPLDIPEMDLSKIDECLRDFEEWLDKKFDKQADAFTEWLDDCLSADLDF